MADVPKQLVISNALSVPIQAVTQTFAILARKGNGKSYTGGVIAEEMIDAGMQVVILDPTGVWWGLRSSEDGQSPGLPVYVFGGDHADVPLEPTSGELIADVLVEQGISAILDVSHLSKTKMRTFITDFAERLYHRKSRAEYRTPLHLLIDEADLFCPQRVMRGTERMLGAIDDAVRRGRSRGIGVSLISQRPQAIHKDVLTQCEILICGQLIHQLDRKSVDEWITAHDIEGRREDFMQSLAGLGKGEFWIWSPAWLNVFERVWIRRKRTFDSSRTPEPGEQFHTPRVLADVDLDQLRERIEASVERAREDDPKHLKSTIRDLKQKLHTAQIAKPEPTTQTVEVKVPVIDRELVKSLQSQFYGLVEASYATVHAAEALRQSIEQAMQAVNGHTQRPVKKQVQNMNKNMTNTAPAPDVGQPNLRAGARRMLETLAVRHPLRVTRAQLGTLAGFSPRGGTFRTYLGDLRRAGFIEQDGFGDITITDAGLSYLGPDMPTAPQTTEDVHAMWRGNLRAGERRMMDVLIDAYPDALTRAELADQSGFEASGGTFRTYLGTLRRNGLADVNGDRIQAGEALFL